MEGQDQEDSVLLVTQGSLVHQSIPTFIGMSGPGIQSAPLPFFFLKQQSVLNGTSHVRVCIFVTD